MPTYCIAYNCKNYIDKKSGLSAHKFPKDRELRQRWIIATKRKGFNPSSTSSLCSDHFEESAFETGGLRRRLKKDAVPTLFQFPPHLITEPPKRRIINRIMIEEQQLGEETEVTTCEYNKPGEESSVPSTSEPSKEKLNTINVDETEETEQNLETAVNAYLEPQAKRTKLKDSTQSDLISLACKVILDRDKLELILKKINQDLIRHLSQSTKNVGFHFTSRLTRGAKKRRVRLQNETAEQRSRRLSQARNYIASLRESEDPEQRHERLSLNRAYMARLRANRASYEKQVHRSQMMEEASSYWTTAVPDQRNRHVSRRTEPKPSASEIIQEQRRQWAMAGLIDYQSDFQNRPEASFRILNHDELSSLLEFPSHFLSRERTTQSTGTPQDQESSDVMSEIQSTNMTDLTSNISLQPTKTEDEPELTQARIWASKLQTIDPEQRLYAEKAINDILFEAQLGTLHRNSVTINDIPYNHPTSTSSTHDWDEHPPTIELVSVKQEDDPDDASGSTD